MLLLIVTYLRDWPYAKDTESIERTGLGRLSRINARTICYAPEVGAAVREGAYVGVSQRWTIGAHAIKGRKTPLSKRLRVT